MTDNHEVFEAFITKYALTQGILTVSVETNPSISPTMVSDKRPGHFHSHYHKNDWHRTRAEAVAHVKQMIQKKRKSIAQQLKRLDKLEEECS